MTTVRLVVVKLEEGRILSSITANSGVRRWLVAADVDQLIGALV
jgi:hypothetical protein